MFDESNVTVTSSTCYSADDVAKVVLMLINGVHPDRWSTARTVPKKFEVDLQYVGRDEVGWGEVAETRTSNYMSKNRFNSIWGDTFKARVYVPRKSELMSHDDINQLVWATTTPHLMPQETVRALAKYLIKTWVLDRGAQLNSKGYTYATSYETNPVQYNPDELPTVRIVKIKRSAVKRTKDERIAASLGEYGNNPRLVGSSSTPQYMWAQRMRQAARYYVREYERREAWKDRAIKAGADASEIVEHETFSDYLRRLADEVDHHKDPNWARFWQP